MNGYRLFLCSWLTCVSLVTLVVGQEPAAPAPETASRGGESRLREQTIYIPYTKLREKFEKDGRGVFLTYEQFQELWQQARQSQPRPAEQRPPVGAVITAIDSEAVAERDVMLVTAKLKIDVLGKGWHTVPLRLSDAAVRSARLGDSAARITFQPKTGFQLLVRSELDEPTTLDLELEYVKAFEKSPGLNRVRFAAPQSPINRWRIRVPQEGVKISVSPFIAATEEPDTAEKPAEEKPAEESPKSTTVMAFVGAAPEVKIEWTPKTEGATGLAALATVQTQQEVRLEEGALRTRCRLDYAISRAELSRLTVVVPLEQRVTGVFDANVRQWDVVRDGDQQTVTIQLFELAKTTQSVTIEMEQFSGSFAIGDVRIPVIQATGVERQQGTVVVLVEEELRAEPVQRRGLVQLDASELPPDLRNSPWSFAFRYAALPFELVLRVEKIKPRIRSDELVEMFLEPEQITVNWLILFDIQQAGVFQLDLDIPAGYTLRQVRGQAAGGAAAAVVDSYAVEGDAKTRLKVQLARKALGRAGLVVELSRRLEDANLVAPTGQTTQLPWPLPRTAMGLEHSQGRLVLYAPESLRVTPDARAGARTTTIAEALQGVESQRQGRFPALREVVAFVYSSEPVELSLSIERRKPQVDARQFLTVRVETGLVKYDATVTFDVKYSPVESLRIDLPTALTSEIRNVTPGLRERTLEPRPADVAATDTAWVFTGEREFLGTVAVRLTWEEKRPELNVGQTSDIPIPRLAPRGVDRSWGQIAVIKAESLEVAASPQSIGLRPIDPQHDLMDGVRIGEVARAFEYHEDWSLALRATRYQLEDVKRTSVERAVLSMVLTRGGDVSVQAVYRVRSAVQRLLIQLPEGRQFDSDPVRINGRPVQPERGDTEEDLFVPLVGQNAMQPFVLELRYTVPSNHNRLDFPFFPEQPPTQSEPAVQKVYLLAYIPHDRSLIGSWGPWTSEEDTRRRDRSQSLAPRALLDWVTEGIVVTSHPADTFATDGAVRTFSTLHPP
ncbi:MAG: hypothetical protein AB7F89_23915, partial [Pirellulaceae bacterium]